VGPTVRATVASTGSTKPLTRLAQTLAHVQVAAAEALGALPAAERAGLPRVRVRGVPALLDEVLPYVRQKHARYWRTGSGPRAALMPRLPAVLDRAAALRERLEAWAAELAGGPWPESADHEDLHAENAVVQADGRLLLFDWEDAAVSCPLFSLHELLDTARGLGGAPAAGAVRRAYVDALPWGAGPQRERALDLALALVPAKKAATYVCRDRAIGRTEGNRHLAAVLTAGLHAWEALTAAESSSTAGAPAPPPGL
jgi:hypothetical protein